MDRRIAECVAAWRQSESEAGAFLERPMCIDSDMRLGKHVESAAHLIDAAEAVHLGMNHLIDDMLKVPDHTMSHTLLRLLRDKLWFYSLVRIRDDVVAQIRRDCLFIYTTATPEELLSYAKHAATAWDQRKRAGKIFVSIKETLSRLDHIE